MDELKIAEVQLENTVDDLSSYINHLEISAAHDNFGEDFKNLVLKLKALENERAKKRESLNELNKHIEYANGVLNSYTPELQNTDQLCVGLNYYKTEKLGLIANLTIEMETLAEKKKNLIKEHGLLLTKAYNDARDCFPN